MSHKYAVDFDLPEEMDAIEGKDIPAIMYNGTVYNTESGECADFIFVPLSGEISFDTEWTDENDDLFDQNDLIRETARIEHRRAYYVGADGVPFIAEEIEDGMYTYSKYWRLFNEVDGYWTETDESYMINARVIDLTRYMNLMIGYSWQKNK